MTRNEKILLIELLLWDVRLNFADNVSPRVKFAKTLCMELGGDFEILAKDCDEFLADSSCDGRYFRDDFPHGYENMETLHGLSHSFKDKSSEFQKYVKTYITCPNYVFSDC